MVRVFPLRFISVFKKNIIFRFSNNLQAEIGERETIEQGVVKKN